jgi:hypothetical protein
MSKIILETNYKIYENMVLEIKKQLNKYLLDEFEIVVKDVSKKEFETILNENRLSYIEIYTIEEGKEIYYDIYCLELDKTIEHNIMYIINEINRKNYNDMKYLLINKNDEDMK